MVSKLRTHDAQTNKEFAESLDADFPLLSNPDKGVASDLIPTRGCRSPIV